MLDTCTCVAAIRKKSPGLLEKIRGFLPYDLCLSAITLAELEHGVFNSSNIKKNGEALVRFLAGIRVLPFDEKAAAAYGEIRAELQRKGSLIGSFDQLIAAHALAHNLILVTHNTREFERIDGLNLEDWIVTN